MNKNIWNKAKCPQYRGVHISGVSFKRGSTIIRPYQVCEGHPRAGQGDAGLECLCRAGLHRQEHGDLAQGRGGAPEPSHQRPPLGAAHAGYPGERGAGGCPCC